VGTGLFDPLSFAVQSCGYFSLWIDVAGFLGWEKQGGSVGGT
jgi:hypothetical protein